MIIRSSSLRETTPEDILTGKMIPVGINTGKMMPENIIDEPIRDSTYLELYLELAASRHRMVCVGWNFFGVPLFWPPEAC